MTSILVVDDDDQLRVALHRQLTAIGFQVESVASVPAAIEALRRRPDVVLTDLRMSDQDGIDLLMELPAVSKDTVPILMSAYATARDHEKATSLGAVKVLSKPFTPDELRDAVAQALDAGKGFRGSIHGLSLVDLLQMFHYGQRSITLLVGGSRPGVIHLEGGQILDARAGEERGEKALGLLLAAGSGSVRTAPSRPTERTIHRPLDALLLDLLRLIDESSTAHSESSESIAPGIAEWSAGSADPGDAGARAEASKVHGGGRRMGKIDDACKEAVAKVDGAVACGVVDLDTGMLLGIHNSAQYTQTLNEVVAGATMDMFRGANVGRIEQMVRTHRGMPEDGGHYFEEIHVTSRHNYHFMKTIRSGKAVIVLVTKKTTNIGLGWASLKSVIPSIEPHVP